MQPKTTFSRLPCWRCVACLMPRSFVS
uniref:Uncharacterized protein n=1 Tax=Rhizophora mucronata TaxID=61149 RepID=A0A2P2QXA5_RHIMU